MAADIFDVYLEMESAWRTTIPKKLQGLKPRELVDLVRLAKAENGVSQGDAASALGQSPTGMSKIAAKLVQHKWIVVTRSTDNHKKNLLTATSKAHMAMAGLEGKFASAMHTPVAPPARPKPDKKADAKKRMYGDRTLLTLSVERDET